MKGAGEMMIQTYDLREQRRAQRKAFLAETTDHHKISRNAPLALFVGKTGTVRR